MNQYLHIILASVLQHDCLNVLANLERLPLARRGVYCLLEILHIVAAVFLILGSIPGLRWQLHPQPAFAALRLLPRRQQIKLVPLFTP